MKKLIRFGVSIEESLLDKFDHHIQARAYTNRSEAIRDLIRDELIRVAWEEGTDELAGTITLIYDHHVRDLTMVLTDIQHKYNAEIISSMHVHLDAHNCLEVLAVKGKPQQLRDIADRLISTRGVKHGKLVTTTSGKNV
ncbi:nickel-responsive transcriptional regulator NikR [candidate division KSB1 bacterium]|nr:nickel-responsive transcriptional regulator NikR [candidate division KSB1 bacterium]